MLFSVARFHIIGYVVHRPSGQLKVIGQERGCKRHIKIDRTANETIARLSREKIDAGLHRRIFKLFIDRFLCDQSEVNHAVALVIDRLCRNDILPRMKSLSRFTGQRN